MIRFRSTHNDLLTSLSPRTTRRLATIEAAPARHSLDDVARLASHGHFDRSPSLQLHLDDGIRHCRGCGQTGDVVERVCQSESGDGVGDPHPRLGLHANTRVGRTRIVSLVVDLFPPPPPLGRYYRHTRREMTPDPALLVTADGPAL